MVRVFHAELEEANPREEASKPRGLKQEQNEYYLSCNFSARKSTSCVEPAACEGVFGAMSLSCTADQVECSRH